MKPFPKSPFAGRLCRIRAGGGIDVVLERLSQQTGRQILMAPIEDTRWHGFWLRSKTSLVGGDSPDADGLYSYPFLVRAANERYILVSRESALVDLILERAGVGGHVDSPRVQVDRAARDLVFPDTEHQKSITGRKYTIGAIWGAVEGYARALRNLSFFGDDLAEAELFRYALQQITVTRIGLRDPVIDKELLSISSTGSLDFQYRGANHLVAIDTLTTYMRKNGYIEWRAGKIWTPDTNQSPTNPSGESPEI